MPNLQQKARWNDKELPENIEQEWNAIIDKLIQQEYALNEFGEIEPHILLFTEDAKETALRMAASLLRVVRPGDKRHNREYLL